MIKKTDDWLIDFNGISFRLGLFYIKRLGNCIHCTTFIFTFLGCFFFLYAVRIIQIIFKDLNPQVGRLQKKRVSWVWHKTASDSEATVLEIWGVSRIPSLQLLSCPLTPGVLLPFRVQSMGQINEFKNDSCSIGLCATTSLEEASLWIQNWQCWTLEQKHSLGTNRVRTEKKTLTNWKVKGIEKDNIFCQKPLCHQHQWVRKVTHHIKMIYKVHLLLLSSACHPNWASFSFGLELS